MRWDDHDRWAKKRGIPEHVSRYVNRIVDVDDSDDYPSDYHTAIDELAASKAERDGAKIGNSALGLVIAKDTKERHDPSATMATRGDISKELHREFFRQKGEKYLDAWYLHHHLDFLHEHRDSGNSIPQLLREYGQRSVRPYSEDVEEFLMNHVEALRDELLL